MFFYNYYFICRALQHALLTSNKFSRANILPYVECDVLGFFYNLFDSKRGLK